VTRRIDSWFGIVARGSTVRTEVLGGLVTFVTMAYIIVVNPAILQAAGIPAGPSTVATILVAVVGTLLMGLYANRPIGVAPYMGENAFIAYTVVLGLGFTWQQGLGAVFVGGLVFVGITALGVRGWLAGAIPRSLKFSFGVGIGLFLAFIGLYETGIVTSGAAGLPPGALLDPQAGTLGAPPVPVQLGDLGQPTVLLAAGCFLLIAVLMALRVRAAILLGMAVTAVAGVALGHGEAPRAIVALPFAGEYSLAPIAFELDIRGAFQAAFLPVLLTIFVMDFLDTIGTLIGVGAAGGMLDDRGDFVDVGKPMMADAVASVSAALLGTTTAGAYVESATGIEEGARTGLAATVTALCFALSLLFIPLLAPVQALAYAYGPPLVIVGILMMRNVRELEFDDFTELVPAIGTILLIIFTFNIGNGLTAGLLLYPLMKLVTGRWREISPGLLVLSALSLLYFVVGLRH
jgi:AGZA family xanthine/uracil permease-like MFS transporter